MLNLNCAVMILPVVRSLVMFLHDATSFRAPWWLRWVPYMLPLDKNVVFHKVRPLVVCVQCWVGWHGM